MWHEYILHKNVEKSSSKCCPGKAPEYCEGLDPSDEDDGGLAGHKGEDEKGHFTRLLTQHLKSVLFCQELL